MKILLTVPRYVVKVGQYTNFPLGPAYLSAFLQRAGHEVKCVNLNHAQEDDTTCLQAIIDTFKPDIFATGGLSVHYQTIKKLISVARSIGPHLPIVVGNGLPSAEPELTLTHTEADIAVIGEGEETFLELLEFLADGRDLHEVKGIAFKNEHQQIQITPSRPPIENLDSLPVPDYEGFGIEHHLNAQRPSDHHLFHHTDTPRSIEIISSRSCPYSCTFCFHPLGNRYRERSLDHLFTEIDHLIDQYQVNILAILDELFAHNQERLDQFCSRIKTYNVRWMVQLRVDSVTDELLKKMKDSGCVYISFGLESMHPDVLASMNKKISPAQIEQALQLAYKHKIGIQGNFIFGDRAETVSTSEHTLAWWLANRHYQINLTSIQSYPGTKIYSYAVQQKIIKNNVEFHEKGCPPINITQMGTEDFSNLHRRIQDLNTNNLFSGELTSYEQQRQDDPLRGTQYSFACICPHCHEKIKYNNMPQDVMPFGRSNLRLCCRNCNQRFDLPAIPAAG